MQILHWNPWLQGGFIWDCILILFQTNVTLHCLFSSTKAICIIYKHKVFFEWAQILQNIDLFHINHAVL